MSIIINPIKGQDHKLGIRETLALLAIHYRALDSNIILNLANKYMIDITHSGGWDKFITTEKGASTIEAILASSNLENEIPATKSPYLDLAKKLQEIYPSGCKEGTGNQWRDSTFAIADRLRILVNRTGIKFTDEQAIEATKRYVESFNGNYRYMQLLKFYICRPVSTGTDVTMESKLITCIENPDMIINNNWTADVI